MNRFLMILLTVVMIFGLTPIWAQSDDTSDFPELDAAVAWVISQQQPDGGWSDGFNEGSSLSATTDAIFALTTAGIDIATLVNENGNTPLDYLATIVAESEEVTPGNIAKTVTVLVAIGIDPMDFNGVNLVELLLASQNEDGLFVDDLSGVFGHCLVMVALINVGGEEPDDDIVESLEAATIAVDRLQNEDGGWGFALEGASDTNTTAICVQGLVLLDDETAWGATGAALEYFGAIQNDDGGWPYQNPSDYGTDSDANSTSLTLQALNVSGVDLDAWNLEDMVTYLLSLQNESGSFSFSTAFPGDNFLATAAVIPALGGYAYSDARLVVEMASMETE